MCFMTVSPLVVTQKPLFDTRTSYCVGYQELGTMEWDYNLLFQSNDIRWATRLLRRIQSYSICIQIFSILKVICQQQSYPFDLKAWPLPYFIYCTSMNKCPWTDKGPTPISGHTLGHNVKSKCSVSKLVNWHMIFRLCLMLSGLGNFGWLSYLEYEQ